LNLRYLITIANSKRRTRSSSIVTFGSVSPNASSPRPNALSLLKDRNGAITLNLPMSGSLDDPQFSIWGMVVQVVTNLIAKAATAPFALIGAVLGGGSDEEMNQVEFAYGRATVDESGQEKLKKISLSRSDVVESGDCQLCG
jgi:hypothetical protein